MNPTEFDLANIEKSRNVTFKCDVGHYLLEGSEEPIKVGFVVVGTNSEQYASADRDVRAFNIKASSERARDKAELDPTTAAGALDVATAVELQRTLYLRKCVVDWYGFMSDGAPAAFTPEAAEKVLKARPAWSAKVIAAIETEANFVKG